MRIGVILIALVLITTCLVGGTFAKYISTTTGDATATVAKWSFKVNNTEIAITPAAALTFDLFNTVKEADTTTPETDVAAAKIAPGTGGEFALAVENLSEVNATYAIAYTAQNASNIPLEFSTDKTTWGTLDSVAVAATALNMGASATTKTIYWRWAFGDPANNTTDTALGIAAQTTPATVMITATITAAQVD